jgi:hypothetical protein
MSVIVLLLTMGLAGFNKTSASPKPIQMLTTVKTSLNNHFIAYKSNRLYDLGSTNTSAEIKTYNVANPNKPSLLAISPRINNANISWYSLSNNYLYVQASFLGSKSLNYIYAYSISNSSGIPTYSSRLKLNSSVVSMASDSSNHLYLASQTYVTEYSYANKQFKAIARTNPLGTGYFMGGTSIIGNYLVAYSSLNSATDELFNVYNKDTLSLVSSKNLSHSYVTAMTNNGPHIYVALAQATAQPSLMYYNLSNAGQLIPLITAVPIADTIVGGTNATISYADNYVIVTESNIVELYSADTNAHLVFKYPIKNISINSITSDLDNHLYSLNGYSLTSTLSSYLLSR